ncbi:MAG: C-GCAxxG-C-C family (seleno)protein [Chitinophagales bacterium]
MLFLCTGNSCRSQMAEGWANALHNGRIEAFSAGTDPGEVNPLAVKVMAEAGVDISGHRSKHLGEFLGQPFDYVVTLCDSAQAACPVFPGAKQTVHAGFPDPAQATGKPDEIQAEFRRVRDQLKDFVAGLPRSLEVRVAAEAARHKAEQMYADGRFFCSEAVFLVANEYLGHPVPDEMVRLASGFPVGIGTSGCTCGAIAGGVMALGLRYGRTEAGAPMPGMLEAAKELHDRFKSRRKSTCCRVLTKGMTLGSPEHLRHCVGITGEVAADVIELLARPNP